ncbi:hypothetical protein TNCV_3781881 [Trichonephila clavipes]|nr:hypothetical protein TNCV_3781881 [Trichonephila clavipes]
MPLNFPVEDIHLIVQLPVLVIDVFPYLVPHLQWIPPNDVLGYALTHPALTFDTRIIGYGGQDVAEATGRVSDTGLVLHFCGRQ